MIGTEDDIDEQIQLRQKASEAARGTVDKLLRFPEQVN